MVVDYGEKLQSINEGIVARYPFLWVRLPQKSMNSKSTAFDMEICVNFVLFLFFFGNDFFFFFPEVDNQSRVGMPLHFLHASTHETSRRLHDR